MKRSFYQIVLIFLFFVLASGGFYYFYWDYDFAGSIQTLLYIIIIIYYILLRKEWKNKVFILDRAVNLLVITPLFSLITVQFYYGQSAYARKRDGLVMAIFLLYYLFIYLRIKPATLIKSYILIGLLVLFLQVYQQFIPFEALFGKRTEEDMFFMKTTEEIEIRNGIYRFMFDAFFYVSFISLYFSWQKLREKFSVLYLGLFACFIVSIYFYLARQIIAVTLIVLLLSMIKNVKGLVIVFLVIACIAIFSSKYVDILFGEMLAKASDELSSDSYGRIFAYGFFAAKIVSSPIVFLLGNGFLSEEAVWAEVYHFFTSDIGIVGAVYHYGILWLFAYIYVFYVALVKCRDYLPPYIKWFLMTIIVDSILITPMQRPSFMFVFISALYIIEWHHINHKPYNLRKNELIRLHKKCCFE